MSTSTKEAKNILMTGTTFTASETRERPKLHFTPGSMNAQKANLCLRFSSLEDDSIDRHELNYPEDNQSLDYARMNPNMTVPVLEIDDKILTDSREIQRYLMKTYPGKGDAAATDEQKEDIESFINDVCNWDEYLFSYRHLPAAFGDGMHNIRLVCQAEAIQQAVRDNALEEVLRDGQTLRAAYVKKIAQTRALVLLGSGEETPDMKKRIEENDKLLDTICQSAMDLKSKYKGSFLLGDDLTSADAFFAAVVNRLQMRGEEQFRSTFCERFSGMQEWWDSFQQSEQFNVLQQYGNRSMVKSLLLSGKPWKIVGYKLGMYLPRKLPDDIESDVQKEYKRLTEDYLAQKE